MRALLRLLSRVSAFAEYSKMSPANLAIVFGPNLLRSEDQNPMAAIEDSQHINDLTKTLIEQNAYFVDGL